MIREREWYDMYDHRLKFCINWIDGFLNKLGLRDLRLDFGLSKLLNTMDIARLKGDFPRFVRHRLSKVDDEDIISRVNSALDLGMTRRKYLTERTHTELLFFRDLMARDAVILHFNDFRDENYLWSLRGTFSRENRKRYFLKWAKNPGDAVREIRETADTEVHFFDIMHDIEMVEPCKHRSTKVVINYGKDTKDEYLYCGLDGGACQVVGGYCPEEKDVFVPTERLLRFHTT